MLVKTYRGRGRVQELVAPSCTLVSKKKKKKKRFSTHCDKVNFYGIFLSLVSFSWQLIENYRIILKIATKHENKVKMLS